TTVTFVPPPPVLSIKINGKAPAAGVEIVTENEEVEVAASVQTKDNPDGAAVTLSWTGGKSVTLVRNAAATFVPSKAKLAEGVTEIFVSATNRGEGVKVTAESDAIAVRVRRLTKEVPPPSIQLTVHKPFDFRMTGSEPYVVSTPKATVSVTVQEKDKNPI